MRNNYSCITIAINGRFLTQPATGVQRYAFELLLGWDRMIAQGEIDPNHYRLEILTPKLAHPFNAFHHLSMRQVGRLNGNLWEQFELPWYSRGKFLFNPGNIAPIFKLDQAVTIHDASVFAVPYSYSLPFKAKYRLVYTVLAKTARLIITVSDFSKKELIKYCRINPKRITVIPEGSGHILGIKPDHEILEKSKLGKRPYILSVGTNAIHKNIAIVYQAAELMKDQELDFVVVGGDFDHWFRATRITPNDRIIKLGYITDAELKALYENAMAFVFPSLYEGFGLPPLEAMACGCPSIVSLSSSLPDICGDAALYFDPHQPSELVDRIKYIINNPGVRAELHTKGLLQAGKFNWSITAKTTWENLIRCQKKKLA